MGSNDIWENFLKEISLCDVMLWSRVDVKGLKGIKNVEDACSNMGPSRKTKGGERGAKRN